MKKNLYPKFIVEGDSLILSEVTFHKELATVKKRVKGGGWYRMDKENQIITFYGQSYDFGKATLEDIQSCVLSGKVYSDKKMNTNLQVDYKFYYDNGTEIIELKK